MIVPDGTVIKSTKRRKYMRRVIEIRQLGNKVRFASSFDGKWFPPVVTTLTAWDAWCAKHQPKVIRI